MTILIAPDKFKGSLTAQQVCDEVKRALLKWNGALNIITLPMADGGEGSCELLTSFSGGKFITASVHDPLFRNIDARYGISEDNETAFLEMASASGLQLLKKHERNPMQTTTLGIGELIAHALDLGVKKIILGIGGSATNDAGMGMAEALGVQFLSAEGERLKPVGENLRYIHTLDLTHVHPKLSTTAFTIFCDVDNPLYGPHGAAHVFAPQKGANEEMIQILDEGLMHYSSLLEKTFSRTVNFPGAGAGGGLPVSLQVLTNLKVVPGMDFIIQFLKLDDHVRHADIVITGEGKIDEQTLSGKVVSGIARLAKKYDKALFVVAGTCELPEHRLEQLNIRKLITLTNPNVPEEYAIEHAASLLSQRITEELVQHLTD
jgi:glycerate kinase